MTKKKKRKGGRIVTVLVLAIVASVAYGAGPGNWFGAEEEVPIEGVAVRRGPLRISEVVRGNLEATNSISLRSEVDGDMTIMYLAPQGPIEKDALVCELDASALEDQKLVQEIDVKSREADFVKAREQYEIQVIQNQTDIAQAQLALELARLDLEKYMAEEGEWDHELSGAEEAIVLAREELASAEEELRWTRELAAKGFAQGNEVEEDELIRQRREIELARAEREKALMLEYGHRRRRSELEADVQTKQRDVQKTEKQAIARLADYESEREAARYKLTREEEKLADLLDQIGKSKVYAPESGILVHGRRRSRWGSGDPVEEGGDVYRGQEIASIPRSDGMMAKASLHETKLKKVMAGQRCLVQIDALPGRQFEGMVDSVAMLPETGSWMSDPNQRLYPAEISITSGVADMRPGMSCSIEILIEDLEDVLYVPRQCVTLDGSRTVCFVSAGGTVSAQPVVVGQENNKWVEIREGLSEGDIVLLSAPASFEPSKAGENEDGGESLPGWDPNAKVAKSDKGTDASGDEAEGEGGKPSGGADAMKERWANMSEEERKAAMKKWQSSGGGGGSSGGGRSRGRGQP